MAKYGLVNIKPARVGVGKAFRTVADNLIETEVRSFRVKQV